MARSKEEEAKGEALPAYSELPEVVSPVSDLPEVVSPVSDLPEVVTSTSASASAPAPGSAARFAPETAPEPVPTDGPTLASPFAFPSTSSLPAYSASTLHKPLAIPQLVPDAKAPFLDAYSDVLLRRGVTRETWSNFLQTLSGFLAATVSDQAISHAGQMARRVGSVPKRFGKETLAHAKSTGRAIADSARKGNFVGAAAHTVFGGVVWLPVATAVRAVGATVSLPFVALGASVEDPKTPRQRAEAYALAANAKWLHRRGLEAHILETAELAPLLGLGVDEVLGTARSAGDVSAAAQLAALGAHLAEVEVPGSTDLRLGAGSFWLVVTQKPEDEESDRNSERGKGKGKGKRVNK